MNAVVIRVRSATRITIITNTILTNITIISICTLILLINFIYIMCAALTTLEVNIFFISFSNFKV